ncbi:nucleotide-diphospho-sugar transferase [Fomitiporia mediterranea MF3/22]|uniref:nucleotide-diphospho-sugar transferase n=1 Tax=Fomitiporia mediterranea (strain MF3/22) TaxID=694068 RepID=UPI00044074F6|nr:nucleotide-diphospho-sugar transferase [Fomitiporia mediterranea MF3/22]EJD05818.1 nucleotide-diphospho-sugar transferase [Fomitiporia mediterranea MF3/22]
MAPKNLGKEKAIDEGDKEDVLQAVILADSFNNRFKPLTSRTPRCLLPICNAPLLDWTFESLALAGVREIFVICRSHSEQVKAAIRDSKWNHPNSGLVITPIVTAREAFSPGDAMRDIYTHGILSSDFVLVHGDLVSNMRIDDVVRLHKERRRTNRDAIMTMVVKEAGTIHRTRPRGETSVFVLDSKTQECLHYEAVKGYPPQTHARIPREILKDHPELEIRNDLIDCGIDVCSLEVPSLFQDNFDYQDIRTDFVHGVLTSDLLMKNIYCHVVSDGYAARVKDTKSYASISKDILARWTFPIVPDNNYPGTSSISYEHTRGNKYLSVSSPPQLARTSHIGPLTLLGPGTSIASDARVVRSVLGENCFLEQGSSVTDSILWDDVRVEQGAIVEDSVLGKGVTVLRGSRIDRGCLISDGVVVGPEARLKKLTRVSQKLGTTQDTEEDREELESVEAAQTDELRARLGSNSNGMIWPEEEEDSDEDEDEANDRINQRLLRLGDNTSDLELSDEGSITSSSDSEVDSDTDDDEAGALGLSLASSATSLDPSAGALSVVAELAGKQAEREFQAEVSASLARAFAEGHSVDNAAVELKTLRMASNVPLRRVREAVVAGVVELIPLVSDSSAQQRTEIAKVIKRWGQLINTIGGVDAVETVSVLQEHCARSPHLSLFGQILASLYQHDVVEEDDIRAWYALPASRGEGSGVAKENMHKCWLVGAKMIEQFDEQADSDEDEDGDDEDDDDEEEEEGTEGDDESD